MDLTKNPNQTEDQQSLKTGFQALYKNPLYRSLFLDRQSQSFDKSPPYPKEEIEHINASEKLEEMVKMTEEPILQIQTVFPFVIFPNEIIVDVNKVSIIYRQFFYSKQVHSVLIKDISDVIVETNLFFATLKIVDIGYTENSIDINYLKRKEGGLARRIIQGLVMAHKHGIDLTKVDKKNLVNQIESLGTNYTL